MRWLLTKGFTLSASKIAGGYLVFGLLWVGTTDWLALQIARTQSEFLWIQSVKGWVFVALSSVLVFGLVSVRESQFRATHDRLTIATEQLQVIHRVFRHNLRNELTIIRGYLHSVKSGLNQADLKRQLSTVEQAVDRLEQVNEDLQILQDVGEPGTEIIDLIPLIEDECNRLRTEIQAITIDVDLPDTTHIYGDPSVHLLLRKMLEALSVRHSSGSESTHLELTVTQTGSEVAVVARSPDHHIPETEVSPIETGEEQPLSHALSVDLWVLKWLANRFDGDVDIRVTPEHTTISVSLLPATQLDQLTKEVNQRIAATVDELGQ